MDIQAVGSAVVAHSASNAQPVVSKPPVVVQQPVAPEPDIKQVQQAVDSINKTIQHFSPDLQFSVDSITKGVVVTVTDKSTGELIRQIPTEVSLQIARTLDVLQGLLIRQKI